MKIDQGQLRVIPECLRNDLEKSGAFDVSGGQQAGMRLLQHRVAITRMANQLPCAARHGVEQRTKDLLIEKGYDPAYGARPMRRAVERYLEDPMAEEILRGNIKAGDTALVSADKGKLTFQPQTPVKEEPAGAS